MDENKINKQRQYDTCVISVMPTITAEGILHIVKKGKPKALILSTFASGTTPGWINPAIQEITQMGIPVFLLSDNKGDRDGIRNPKHYGAQEDSYLAGAIALQKVNVNSGTEVLDAIQDEIDAGKSGATLGEAIRTKFAYASALEVPKAKWEIPEGIAALQKETKHTVVAPLSRGES